MSPCDPEAAKFLPRVVWYRQEQLAVNKILTKRFPVLLESDGGEPFPDVVDLRHSKTVAVSNSGCAVDLTVQLRASISFGSSALHTGGQCINA